MSELVVVQEVTRFFPIWGLHDFWYTLRLQCCYIRIIVDFNWQMQAWSPFSFGLDSYNEKAVANKQLGGSVDSLVCKLSLLSLTLSFVQHIARGECNLLVFNVSYDYVLLIMTDEVHINGNILSFCAFTNIWCQFQSFDALIQEVVKVSKERKSEAVEIKVIYRQCFFFN